MRIITLILALGLPFIGIHPTLAQPTFLVVNQGNFGDNNGSITLNHNNILTQDFIADIGSIIQSVHVVGSKLYVMSNTGGRIDVFDLDTGDQIAQIPNLTSPRYMASLNDTKGYVTNLFGGGLTVLDLIADTVLTTVAVGDNPEGLTLSGNRLYVANPDFGSGTTLSVINTDTDTLIDTIELGCDGPRLLFTDAEDEIVVFCTGKTQYNDDFTEIIAQTNGQIVFWDGGAGKATDRIHLSQQLGTVDRIGQDAFYDPLSREAYAVVGQQILRIDTEMNQLVDSLTVPDDDLIGAVAYDGTGERLYVGRLPLTGGYTTPGYINVLDRAGTAVGDWNAGIAPAFIAILNRLDTQTEPLAGDLPRGYALHANYPNPFNPSTTFEFALPEQAPVQLNIYSVLGNEVARVVHETLPAGSYRTVWHAENLPSGVYFYRLQAGAFTQTRTLILIK